LIATVVFEFGTLEPVTASQISTTSLVFDELSNCAENCKLYTPVCCAVILLPLTILNPLAKTVVLNFIEYAVFALPLCVVVSLNSP